jgi:hypothetical protein
MDIVSTAIECAGPNDNQKFVAIRPYRKKETRMVYQISPKLPMATDENF